MDENIYSLKSVAEKFLTETDGIRNSVSTETRLLLDEIVERLESAQCSKKRIEEISLRFKSAVNYKGDKGAWKDDNDNIHINDMRLLSGSHFSIAKDGSIKMIARS